MSLKRNLLLPATLLAVSGQACAGTVARTRGTAPNAAAQNANSESDAVQRYFDKGYDYCDASVLATAWDGDFYNAKVKAGTMLLRGDSATLEMAFRAARSDIAEPGKVCPFWESGYSFEDAQAIASLYGMDTWDAKTMIESKLVWGNRAEVNEILAEARGASEARGGEGEDPLSTFWANYGWCDAAVLADHWEIDVMEAKTFAGEKINYGSKSSLEQVLDEARPTAAERADELCPYWASSLDYDDALALAALWGIEVWDAKARVEKKLVWGNEDLVNQIVAEAHNNSGK